MTDSPISRDEALRLLLSRRGSLIAYLYTYVRDLHIAEDLFQEVALRVVDKHQEIQDPAQAYSWLRSVSRNCAIDWLRREQHRPMPLDEQTLELLDQEWRRVQQQDSSELHDALSHCLGKLTPRARQFIEQRFKNQMSTQEIAEAIGRKRESVYTTFSRIYASLSECIKQKLPRKGLDHA